MSTLVTCSIACDRYVDCDVVITAEADVGACGGAREARAAAQADVEKQAQDAGWDLGCAGMPDICPKCTAAENEFKDRVVNAVAALLDSKGMANEASYVREWGWIDFEDYADTREKRIGAVLRAVKRLKQDELGDVLLMIGREQGAAHP